MSEALQLESVLRRSEAVVSRRIAGEAVLVPLRARAGELDAIYALNETAALAWDLLDGRTPLGAVVERITAEFEVGRDEAARDLLALASHLESLGVVERV